MSFSSLPNQLLCILFITHKSNNNLTTHPVSKRLNHRPVILLILFPTLLSDSTHTVPTLTLPRRHPSTITVTSPTGTKSLCGGHRRVPFQFK